MAAVTALTGSSVPTSRSTVRAMAVFSLPRHVEIVADDSDRLYPDGCL
jgi:hypothetical protein